MKFSKMIFVLTIAASAIFVFMIGSSYAYYTATSTDINVTTGNTSDGVSVIFTDNNYVNITTGVPIDDNMVDNYVDGNKFSIIPNVNTLNGYDAFITIALINVNIDDSLKINSFKYKLICIDDNSDVVKSTTGNGTSLVSGTDVVLSKFNTTDNSFDINTNYQCTFKVWISNSGNNQNELMNKKFSALLEVNSIMRKQ